jgi:hypothetical protein
MFVAGIFLLKSGLYG